MKNKLVIGIDYGSDSVRVIIVEAMNGKTIAEGVSLYSRWSRKLYCDAKKNQYRQHALDYLEGMEKAMEIAFGKLDTDARNAIVGLSIDTTGSTPCPVNREGTALCLIDKYQDNPNAMFHLWKDHTAIEEAKEINNIFSNGEVDYTKYQGIYSSEWFWAKILHTIRIDEEIRKDAWMWVEHSDWIAAELSGDTRPEKIYKCACAAGHKALWNSEFEGLPNKKCLMKLDSYLGDIYDRYGANVVPAGTCVGTISKKWAKRLNINPNTNIAMGSFDAHAGGVGAGLQLGTMVKVVGTSTVDMVIEDKAVLKDKDLRAYCGQAEDSIVPGYMGVEMSQPAFGDVYAWLQKTVLWPMYHIEIPDSILSQQQCMELRQYMEQELLKQLGEEVEENLMNNVVALDWFNGRRYPFLNEDVRAAISELSLGTSLPDLYAALIKATIFGSKRIYDSLLENDVTIHRIIAVGGIAQKSKVIMQCMADVFGVPIMVCKEEQTCAKGAAIFAAVGAGVFDSVIQCQDNYCEQYKATYYPDEGKKEQYESMYRKYLLLGKMIEEK